MTEDEMVGWHHGLNGWEFEQALSNKNKTRIHCHYSRVLLESYWYDGKF